jgi:hypothetical protein
MSEHELPFGKTSAVRPNMADCEAHLIKDRRNQQMSMTRLRILLTAHDRHGVLSRSFVQAREPVIERLCHADLSVGRHFVLEAGRMLTI